MVVIGGEATADLKDFWAFDILDGRWYNPEINYLDHYTPKRFHTANSINETQIVTFGGCHSEYVHLNEMHLFDLTKFLQNPKAEGQLINCTRINVTEGLPSTRWGHAASTYNNSLYILGGRNEQDIIDLHEFSFNTLKWKEIEIKGQLPKPRRRHSGLFVSGSFIMFGGFDGSFYNDLQFLDFLSPKKQVIQLQESTMYSDYHRLINQKDSFDIKFILDNHDKSLIFAHKALVLFRTIQREIKLEQSSLSQVVSTPKAPTFIRDVYSA